MKAYQLYAAEVSTNGVEPLLSITRAWRLVKFVDSGMLCLTGCKRCGGQFVNHAYELDRELRVRAVRAAGARRQGAPRRADPLSGRRRPTNGRTGSRRPREPVGGRSDLPPFSFCPGAFRPSCGGRAVWRSGVPPDA